MKLNQNIETHGTNSITTYGDAKTFVENLANYLKVQTQLPSNLKMISVGTSAPSSEYQDVPWLELDANNNPKYLKFYNGSSWEPIVSDLSIKNQVGGFQIQQGTFSMVINDSTGNSEDTVDGGKFLFPITFASDANPIVTITPMHCSVYEALSADGNENTSFDYWVSGVESDGFNIGYHVREIQDLLTNVNVTANKETVQAFTNIIPNTTDVSSVAHTHNLSGQTNTTTNVASLDHTHSIPSSTTSSHNQTVGDASAHTTDAINHTHTVSHADTNQTTASDSVVDTITFASSTDTASLSTDKISVLESLTLTDDMKTQVIKAENFLIQTDAFIKESFNNNRPITGANQGKTFKFSYMAIGKAL